LRERLADVKNSAEPDQQLQSIVNDIAAHSKILLDELASLFDDASAESLQQARAVTRKLQFFRRLSEEVDTLEDELADY